MALRVAGIAAMRGATALSARAAGAAVVRITSPNATARGAGQMVVLPATQTFQNVRGFATSAADVEAGVIEVIQGFLKDKPGTAVTGTSHFSNDLGLDSLDAVELVMEIETKFDLEIDEEQIDNMTSVDAIVAYIAAQNRPRQPGAAAAFAASAKATPTPSKGPNRPTGSLSDINPRAWDTRNVSIIAHVDHGKTTLADALLHKSGKISTAKAGDQTTGRALDTSKEERERGITIKSTGICLDYDVDAAFFERVDAEIAMRHGDAVVESVESSSSSSEDESDSDGPTDLYLGDLPLSTTDADTDAVRHILAEAGGCDFEQVTGAKINGKRHFAFATVPSQAVRKILSRAVSAEGIVVDGRKITVTRRGSSAVKQLAEVLRTKRYPPAKYDVAPAADAEGKWTGKAVVEGLGLVVTREPQATQKAAREHLALALLALESPPKVADVDKEEPVAVAASAATPRDRTFTINLIDSPGHIEFNAEVTSALRMTDGALVVVDVIDGASAQTETVLRQALREGVRPVLMLNKVDNLLLQKQFTPEQVYDRFIEVINQINTLIAESHDDEQFFVSLEGGTVAFGSGYFQWAASLDSFVTMANPSLRDSAARAKLRRKLSNKKNFVKNVLSGIFKVHSQLGLLYDGVDAPVDVAAWLGEFNAKIVKKGGQPCSVPTKVEELAPRKVLKLAMASLLPAAEALVEMIAMHIPAPTFAQGTRVATLTSSPSSSEDEDPDAAKSAALTQDLVRRCDPTAPLLIYVSKICQPSEAGSGHGGGLAVCRCFSGSIRAGQMIQVAGAGGRSAKVTAVSMCAGKTMQSIGVGTAGQIFALSGVAGLLRKNGTLTDEPSVASLRGMSFSVSPVVQKSVRPAEPRQLQKMVEALRKTTQADQTALFYHDRETNQHVLAGTGELHLEVLLHSVEDVYNVKIIASEPMVSFRESVSMTSSQRALKKSANKLNRVWFTASPLSAELVDEMDTGKLDCTDVKAMARELVDRHGWDRVSARRIWAVGPEPLVAFAKDGDADAIGQPTCILVNSTTGLQIPGDVKDTIISSFKRVCREGALAGEQLHGVRFDLVDGMFHADSNHRSGAQLDPAVRSALRGAVAFASPCIVQPLYRLEVSGPSAAINTTYSEITGRRRGKVVDSTTSDTGTQGTIIAEMPIRLAFGLREAISCRCLLMTSFAGWSVVEGDVTDAEGGGEARDLICSIRSSKKMSPEPPKGSDFVDRL